MREMYLQVILFILPLHHHDICSHLYIVLVFVRVVHIVNYSVYSYFRLFLLYLSSKKKNLLLLYSHVTYLYLINYTYSP